MKCDWPTEMSSESTQNKLAHFGPTVTAMHKTPSDSNPTRGNTLSSVSHLLRYDFYGWETGFSDGKTFYLTTDPDFGKPCYAQITTGGRYEWPPKSGDWHTENCDFLARPVYDFIQWEKAKGYNSI